MDGQALPRAAGRRAPRWAPAAKHRQVERWTRAAERRASRGRLLAAVRCYRRALAADPDNLRLLNRTGDLLARARRLDRALPLFLRVGERYAADGFAGKAAAIYTKVLRFAPGRPEAVAALSWLTERRPRG